MKVRIKHFLKKNGMEIGSSYENVHKLEKKTKDS